MAASTVSAASWSSTGASSISMYLDEHGFILNGNQTPPAPLTQKQADKDNRKLDKWIRMLVRWGDTVADYPKLKKRIRIGGIPGSLRGLTWQLLLGSREKQLESPGLYASLRERDMDPNLAEIIKRDLGRTFPTHALFLGSGGVGQKALFSMLQAYAVYDPKIGYCQGMGFIAATLLTQMQEEEAFWAFSVMMKHPKFELGELYLPGFPKVQESFEILQMLLEAFSPTLAEHFKAEGVNVNYFASQWFMTLFVYLFPFNLLLRVWDVFFNEGWKVIYRVALLLLLSDEATLLKMSMEEILPRLKVLHADKDPGLLLAQACKIKVTNRELRAMTELIRQRNEG